MFPQKHAFSYSYLFVGVPVDVRGRISRALSVDSPTPGWFDVQSADYLSRGTARQGMTEKLKRYLQTQGVTDREYSFAYLVTAPRFVGYSFNPVSFWYLYDSDAMLKFMILEVNNTFDERRVYLLKPDREGACDAGQTVFTETFDKDFHVSPFNSRKGSYSLRAIDPLAAFERTGRYSFDNTIVLRSSKESAKIVARVYSEGTPQDATTISRFELFRFIASWWWVGFVTFPRIVWQARTLFFQKKLHVWYRPEVTDTSVGRTYTTDEVVLEEYFQAFLKDAVSHCEKPLRLVYTPAHEREVAMYSPGFTYEEDHRRTLELRVTSPAFYSRFAHYAHAKEAFDRECLTTDEKNRTVFITSPELLPLLLYGIRQPSVKGKVGKQNIIERSRWSLLRRLRCPPPLASYPGDSDHHVSDIRAFGDAELDVFVKRAARMPSRYRRTVTKLFLASRIALGLSVLVIALDWLLRAAMILATLLFCRLSTPFDAFRASTFGAHEMWTTEALLMLANGVHLWSLLKG
ncbi:uncharacterized protein LTR77_006634 [Saxophila tyrrhenica]|uniref:DUF1365 domain-containing protein n=1 Tax=Saxophila tyrrhenica TaxID=1690608 RepID=A0AAV9P5X5_9PEZI|nr:hypothetical protein LTR77_006634 [Saxophila tyrrhenica]